MLRQIRTYGVVVRHRRTNRRGSLSSARRGVDPTTLRGANDARKLTIIIVMNASTIHSTLTSAVSPRRANDGGGVTSPRASVGATTRCDAVPLTYDIVINGCRQEFAYRNTGVRTPADYAPGAEVSARREPRNVHDCNAIALYGESSAARIGYIAAIQARRLANMIDDDVVKIDKVVIVTNGGPYLRAKAFLSTFPYKATRAQRTILDRWTMRAANQG